MPRDLSGCGRFPPQPRYQPFAFYSAVRLGDPEMLAKIMQVDPYFVTQDNGAGAPIHFAVTYRQLDVVHHLLNNGAHPNQADPRGLTPLHRAAYLAHLDGYLEIYEYLLSRGADPTLLSAPLDPYLDPERKTPRQMTAHPQVMAALQALEEKYASVPKAPRPHPDLGDWWALYDYGLEVVSSWPHDYVHPYPEVMARSRIKAEQQAERQARREKREAYFRSLEAGGDGSEVLAAYDGGAGSAARPLPTPPPPTAIGTTVGAERVGASPATALALIRPTGPRGERVAFLFPGQGSQVVGMLAASASLPTVAAMLDTAKQVLGYDLLEICTKGPQSALDDTRVAQPALFLSGLAAVEVLRARQPEVVEGVGAVAGLSLGEYTALVFAGAMSFEEGLRVVKVRAEAMAAAAACPPGSSTRAHGMLSVVGLDDAVLERLVEEVAAEAAGGRSGSVCRIANYLFPQGRVVSGHLDLLEAVKQRVLAAGALKATMLQVSGAFHTSIMEPARDELTRALSTVQFRPPRIPVLSNVTAAPFPACPGAPGDPASIRLLLARQLVEPVRWEDTLRALLAAGASPPQPAGSGQGQAASAAEGTTFYELGPGQQIKAMVKRMSLEAWRRMGNVAP